MRKQSISITCILLFNVLFGITASSQLDSLFSFSLVSLSENPDARTSSMGAFGISNGNNSNAIFTNFSQTLFLENSSGFSFSYKSNLHQDEIDWNFSGQIKLSKNQSLGISGQSAKLLDGIFEFPNFERLPSMEYEISVAYGLKLTKNLSIGLRPRLLISDLGTGAQIQGFDIIQGKSLAADLSATYNSDFNNGKDVLTCALTLANWGTKISYVEDQDISLIKNLSGGISYKKEIHYNFTTLLSIGYQHQFSELAFLGNRWSIGNECFLKDLVNLRVGYEKRQIVSVSENIVHLGAGLSFEHISIDLAYSNFIELSSDFFDDDVRISLSYQFK